MSLSNIYETTTLEWLLTATSVTRPTAWYLALYTDSPGEGNTGTEVSGGSYARQSGAFTVTGNTATNSAAVEWPAATADWGVITHMAVFDAETGGNMMIYGALNTAKDIATGDILRLPIGELSITLD